MKPVKSENPLHGPQSFELLAELEVRNHERRIAARKAMGKRYAHHHAPRHPSRMRHEG
jgi:hypothetical protein